MVHPSAPMILADRDGEELPVLPEVQIQQYTRCAEQVTGAVAEKWGLHPIVLFRPEAAGSNAQTLVLTFAQPPSCTGGLRWTTLAEFAGNLLVESALQQLARYEEGELNGPFGRREWIHEVEAWVASCMRPLGVRLTGKTTQYNASPSFALIRMETNESAVWFKAVGDPNRHESSITCELSWRAPEFVPDVIAFHEDWNGWLMHEVVGDPIDMCNRSEAWTSTARSLATLQTRFSGDVENCSGSAVVIDRSPG
jgi:hypothetical protein